MARKLQPLPNNTAKPVQDALVPYIKKVSKAPEDNIFTKNRGKENSLRNSKSRDFSISIQDHDEAVKYYFENTIKPTVIQNNEILSVPIIYGSPERWKSVQESGFYRDANGKIMVPLIMYQRTTLEKNRNLGNKIDGNKVINYQIFEQKFNNRNRYDRFDLLSNRQPSKEYFMSVIPDYVTLTYSCIIFTDYIEQINPIIEAINFASDSYWGDFSRFKFRAKIDNFATTTEVSTSDGRAVRTSFNITLNGYIIPNTINKQIASDKLYYGTSQVIFNLETSTQDLETITSSTPVLTAGSSNSTTIFEGGNVSVTLIGASTYDVDYLGLNITKTSNNISSNTVTFNASFAQPPPGSTLPRTSKENFIFYINGIYTPANYVISFVDNNGGNCILTLDTGGLGYELESTDEITAIGKFS
jgi:hypothetical protein